MASNNRRLVLAVVCVLAGSGVAQYPAITRVNVGPLGVAANAESGAGGMTPDGRFVTFSSHATNLLPVPNGVGQLFLLDRLSLQLEIVSQSTAGAIGNKESDGWSISADGRYVAFSSLATNLVAGDTNGKFDAFVRDRQLGTTTRVSVSAAGIQGNDDSWTPYVADDGRSVVFASLASSLGPGPSIYFGVYSKDLITGQVRRLDVSPTGAPAYDNSWWLTASGDGRLVAYSNAAANLVNGDTNGTADAFVTDTLTGATRRVSISSSGAQSNSYTERPVISRDGSTVAFASFASNLVVNDTNNVSDVFVHELATGLTERVSLTNGGVQLARPCQWPQISGDGRLVAFESLDAYVLPGDTNNDYDIFVFDRAAQQVTCASVGWNGQFVHAGIQIPHFVTALSGDGRYVLFQSQGANIVQGDLNHITDVFLRDYGGPSAVNYCTASTSSNGCIASIAASANPSVSLANPCYISVTDVEGLKWGLIFYGIDNNAFAPIPWAPGSTSFLCVKHPIQRTPLQNSVGTYNTCTGSFVLDWNSYQATNPAALGHPWNTGAKVYAQAWFRDPLAVKSTNLSDAVELTYQP